jgi:hypothetical protein
MATKPQDTWRTQIGIDERSSTFFVAYVQAVGIAGAAKDTGPP